MNNWVGRSVVPVAIALAFALFRRFAPARKPASADWRYEKRQRPEPLPTGVIGATMWGIGLCLIGSFFLFREANHLWARMDGPALIRVYQTQFVWCFFPGFAALSVPWPLTIWLLRKTGRNDEADEIADESSGTTGFNSYRVMKWFSYGLVVPIGLLTALAVPVHLSIGDREVKAGRYGRLSTETFRYDQATGVRLVNTSEVHGGHTIATKNLLIDFADGRTLDASVGQDGGRAASPEVANLLLEKIKLEPVSQ